MNYHNLDLILNEIEIERIQVILFKILYQVINLKVIKDDWNVDEIINIIVDHLNNVIPINTEHIYTFFFLYVSFSSTDFLLIST